MSNPRETIKEIERQEELKIERIKELENLEIEKLKELKNLKRIARENLEKIEIEEKEIEKETIANLTNKLSIIPKKILLSHSLEKIKQLIKPAKERRTTEKCVRMVEIFKDVIIKKMDR